MSYKGKLLSLGGAFFPSIERNAVLPDPRDASSTPPPAGLAAVAAVERAERVGEDVAARTKELDVLGAIVEGVAVLVVEGEGHLPRDGVNPLPAALLALLTARLTHPALDVVGGGDAAADAVLEARQPALDPLSVLVVLLALLAGVLPVGALGVLAAAALAQLGGDPPRGALAWDDLGDRGVHAALLVCVRFAGL
ncbi:MAG: hypothetical protein EOP84_14110 [Verrucomicrobiaceae bacterium]|nr:MAG: hypothetical protein EOP84_14110 [Verrucomicrobiaceae bacterium]